MMNKDIIFYFCQYLDDLDKMNFLSTNKENYHQNNIYYQKCVKLEKIQNLFSINRFSNILVSTNKKLSEFKIPTFITHLTFGRDFNQPVQNDIPRSVTYLTFGYNFNQPI